MVTTLGALMANLDSTIVVIGLPTLLEDLNATIVHGIWIITGYQLIITILLVVLGRLADMRGRVKLYNLGFAVFTIGSLFCGLSRNGEQLVAFRILQGAGGAMLIANSAAIVTDAFPRHQLGTGLGINMMAGTLGAIAGYTLSGVMIAMFGWRSIFLVNVPIGIFATYWGHKQLKEVAARPTGQKFDYAGAILYCVGLSVILLALTIGDPLSVRNLTILAGGFTLFLAVVFVETRQMYPTLDVSLFRIRSFAAGNTAGFLNSLAFHCGPFLRSLYLQMVLGYNPLKAGAILIPMEFLVFIVTPISGRLSDKYGHRWLSSIGLALNASALFWFSTLNENTPFGTVLISLGLFGFGRALFFPPNTSSVMGSVPAEKRGVANGMRTTLNHTGNALSIPFSLMLMTLVMPYDRLSQIVSGSQLVSSNELLTFLKAINHACLVLGIITALAIIPSFLRGKRVSASPNSKITG